MTKTFSIYTAQVLLGATVIAAGYAKLSGAGFMVEQFQALGFGQGFLMMAGAGEMVAGLCLLLPRGGVIGAVVLSCVMVGALGFTIGHVASVAAAPVNAAQYTVSGQSSAAKSGCYDTGKVLTIQRKAEWSI